MKASTGITLAGIGAIALVGFLYHVDQRRQAEREEAEAMAVAYMPEAEVREWERFADEQIAQFISREGGMFRVRERWFDTVSYYPLSQYRIECSIFGVSVDFGGDELGDQVAVTGILAGEAPTLSVHPGSIAAKNLQDRLCRRTAQRMEALAGGR